MSYKGTAQGSPDGPRFIYGKENVNWSGPKRATEHSTLQGNAQSATGDFLSEGQSDDLEAFYEQYLLKNYKPIGNYVMQAFQDTHVHPKHIEEIMDSFIQHVTDVISIEYDGKEQQLDEFDDDVVDDIGDIITQALWDDEDTTYYAAYMYKNIPEEEVINIDSIGYALSVKFAQPESFADYSESIFDYYDYELAIQEAYEHVPWDKRAIIDKNMQATIIDN